MVRLNTASALGGAGTGAAYGAQFGGPIGAGVGGLVGGIAGLFSGGRKKPKKISTMDPTQQGIYQDYASALRGEGGPLADIYGPADLDKLRQLYQQKYAEPAYQSWQENVVPGITGQFRGNNLQNSSYLGGALTKSGENLQKGLNADLEELLYNSQQAATNRRAGGVQNILGMNTFDYEKKQKSLIDELLTSLSSGAGNLVANNPLFKGNSGAPGISGGSVRIGQPARGY
jgi:hypothetical protein